MNISTFLRFFKNRYNLLSLVCLTLAYASSSLFRFFLWGKEPFADLVVAVGMCLVLSLLVLSVRKLWAYFLISIPILLICGKEAFVVIVYRHYMKAANIVSMFITNSSESGSFIQNNIFAILCCVGILSVYILGAWARTKGQTHSRSTLSCAGLLALVLLVAAPWQTMRNLPPFNLPIQNYQAYEFEQMIADAAADRAGMSFGAVQDTVCERETYVLAIGESVVYDHLSLAGYGRPTTPQLDSCRNITLYTDYYTNSALTMLAVPMMMSRATPQDFYKSYRERNICRVFKETGFKVFVLVCLNHLDYDTALTEDVDSVYILKKDADIPVVLDSLANIYPKTFFVTQGLGNHCYFYNFDEEDNVFHPNAYYDQGVKSDSLYYNAYDCTVRFTDRLLRNIIRAIDRPDRRAAMLFVSDHGENVNPGDEHRSVSMSPMKTEYHVPLFFWRNETWQAANPAKEQSIIANKDRETSSNDVFYTLYDLAGIRLPKEKEDTCRMLTRPTYSPKRRYFLAPDVKTVVPLE